jgi:hypothetical protein
MAANLVIAMLGQLPHGSAQDSGLTLEPQSYNRCRHAVRPTILHVERYRDIEIEHRLVQVNQERAGFKWVSSRKLAICTASVGTSRYGLDKPAPHPPLSWPETTLWTSA